jgi:hypothetical protein
VGAARARRTGYASLVVQGHEQACKPDGLAFTAALAQDMVLSAWGCCFLPPIPVLWRPKTREYTFSMTVLEAGERHHELIDELISDVAAYNADVDRDLLRRAFSFAAEKHEGQQRRSGEDFIHHPWGAAKICAELRLDEQTIAAALLHDVVEDTGTDIREVRAEFGDDVAQLFEGVTKLTRFQFQSR